MRPHHWVKNLLVFLPLLAAHQIFEVDKFLKALVSFGCFCLIASAGYILNDYFDVHNDSQHPDKKNRPLAMNRKLFSLGLVCAALLVVLGLLFALSLSLSVSVTLLGYIFLLLVYTLILKKFFLIDLLCLVLFFLLRLVVGHESTHIKYSIWLFSFSFCFFLSLACLKRFGELKLLEFIKQNQVLGRAYYLKHLKFVEMLGQISGYCSVAVFALYIRSSNVEMLYERPSILWLICPLLVFWIRRIWRSYELERRSEDPIDFIFYDPKNYIFFVLFAIILALAL